MWYFKPKTPGDTIREPVQAEFFATDAISDPGMALVREAVQNSLDAGRPDERVMVRIYVSGEQNAVAADRLVRYVEGAWDHLRAESTGLRPEQVPSPEDPCPFITIEDFGTRGLQGDPAEPFRSKTGERNHFYHFFRAEGQSDKSASERGIWGVGKHVFPRSSRISTMFGVTVRADDRGRALVMGKSVLRSHYIGEDYCQDGYFGERADADEHFVMPVDDEGVVDDFCRLFDLQRGGDPGLSVVVPWPHPEITDRSIVLAVLRGYFYPILSGQLDVIVETPSVKTVLDSESLIREVASIGDDLVDELGPLLELADWARQLSEDDVHEIQMPNPNERWQWSKDLFPEDLRRRLQDSHQKSEKIALQIPVTVRKKNDLPVASFFRVYLMRDERELAGRPTFIREGVIIPKVDGPRTRGVVGLVVVDDLPLAGFLRDAENPAHTEWQHDGSNFRGKYQSGQSDLAFVKRSVYEIVRLLSETEQQEDRTLLMHLFSLPAPPEEPDHPAVRGQRAGPQQGPEIVLPPPLPPPQPPRFRIHKLSGGFSVGRGAEGTTPPELLEIRVAYDVRHGSPLRRYSPADFKVDQAPIRLDPVPRGLDIVERQDNRILVAIREPDFSLHVTGFDENRDLYIRAVPRETGHGGTTT